MPVTEEEFTGLKKLMEEMKAELKGIQAENGTMKSELTSQKQIIASQKEMIEAYKEQAKATPPPVLKPDASAKDAAAAASSSVSPEVQAISNLSLALSAHVHGKSDKALEMLNKVNETALKDQLASVRIESDEAAGAQSTLPEDLAPPKLSEFGTTNELSPSEQKGLNSWLTTRKESKDKAKEQLHLEDKLLAVKALQTTYNFKFSEECLVNVLLTILSEDQRKDLLRYRKEKKPLRECWEILMMEYRVSLTRAEAIVALEEALHDLDADVISNLKRIKYLTGETVSSSTELGENALVQAQRYLCLFLPSNDVATLVKLARKDGGDPFANLFQEIKGIRLTEIDKARLEANSGKKVSVKKLKAGTKAGTSTDADGGMARRLHKLESTMGQVVRSQKLASSVPSGPSKYLPEHQQNGYYSQDAKPRQRPSLPQLPQDQYLYMKGKCRLCGHHGKAPGRHNWQNCPTYPGTEPQSSICEICGLGAHAKESYYMNLSPNLGIATEVEMTWRKSGSE